MISVFQGECVQNETGDGGSEDHWVTNNKSLTQDNQEAPAMFFDFVIVSLSLGSITGFLSLQ